MLCDGGTRTDSVPLDYAKSVPSQLHFGKQMMKKGRAEVKDAAGPVNTRRSVTHSACLSAGWICQFDIEKLKTFFTWPMLAAL